MVWAWNKKAPAGSGETGTLQGAVFIMLKRISLLSARYLPDCTSRLISATRRARSSTVSSEAWGRGSRGKSAGLFTFDSRQSVHFPYRQTGDALYPEPFIFYC